LGTGCPTQNIVIDSNVATNISGKFVFLGTSALVPGAPTALISNIRISNNLIAFNMFQGQQNGYVGITWLSSASTWNLDQIEIVNNTFRVDSQPPLPLASLIYMIDLAGNITNLTIKNNQFMTASAQTGVSDGGLIASGGAVCINDQGWNSANIVISNNLFDQMAGAISVAVGGNSPGPMTTAYNYSIENNVVVGATAGIEIKGSIPIQPLTINNNRFQATTAPITFALQGSGSWPFSSANVTPTLLQGALHTAASLSAACNPTSGVYEGSLYQCTETTAGALWVCTAVPSTTSATWTQVAT
jgi:hypothetical protein